jgi:hypothetical protein
MSVVRMQQREFKSIWEVITVLLLVEELAWTFLFFIPFYIFVFVVISYYVFIFWKVVCSYLRMNVCMYVCMYACMYVSVHVCFCVGTYVCVYTLCMYVCRLVYKIMWKMTTLWVFSNQDCLDIRIADLLPSTFVPVWPCYRQMLNGGCEVRLM